jgi:hypothetical protein
VDGYNQAWQQEILQTFVQKNAGWPPLSNKMDKQERG